MSIMDWSSDVCSSDLDPHRGLNAMFVMMNSARLGVGMQSLGLAEMANQQALNYDRDRLQMRAASGPERPDKPERKGGGEGKRVEGRGNIGGRRIYNKQTIKQIVT